MFCHIVIWDALPVRSPSWLSVFGELFSVPLCLTWHKSEPLTSSLFLFSLFNPGSHCFLLQLYKSPCEPDLPVSNLSDLSTLCVYLFTHFCSSWMTWLLMGLWCWISWLFSGSVCLPQAFLRGLLSNPSCFSRAQGSLSVVSLAKLSRLNKMPVSPCPAEQTQLTSNTSSLQSLQPSAALPLRATAPTYTLSSKTLTYWHRSGQHGRKQKDNLSFSLCTHSSCPQHSVKNTNTTTLILRLDLRQQGTARKCHCRWETALSHMGTHNLISSKS